MKHVILLLFLSFISSICFPQDYFPFPKSDAIWKETIQIVGGTGNTTLDKYQLELIGDTTILQETYSKIYKTGNGWELPIGNDDIIDEYMGSIREDSSKHIYFIPKDSHSPFLLYDFNIEVGDTLQSYTDSLYYFYGGTIGNYFVSNIDSIIISGSPRRQYEIEITENPQGFDRYEIIEGIGSINGLLNNKGNTGGYSSWLWCFQNNGELIYSKNEESCINTFQDEPLSENQIICFPNPCQEHISITGINNKKVNVLLLNFEGRILLNELLDHGSDFTNLNLSRIQSGIYMLLIVENEITIYSERIVRL